MESLPVRRKFPVLAAPYNHGRVQTVRWLSPTRQVDNRISGCPNMNRNWLLIELRNEAKSHHVALVARCAAVLRF